MLHFHDVAAGAADQAGDAGELARQVADHQPQPHDPAVAHQTAQQHGSEQARVDIAAAQHEADLAAGKVLRIGQQRSQAGGTGAFGHRLLDFEEEGDGALDGHLVDRQHAIDQGAGDGQRRLADVADGDALGDGVAAHRDLLAGQELAHRRIARRFDADHLHVGPQAARRDGAAGDHAAAAHRHDQRVELGYVFEHFQRDGALARDDAWIVVGMDEDQLLGLGQAVGLGRRLRQRVPLQHDARAMVARVLHLVVGCEGRHHDGRRNAQPARMIGDALRMVAGRHGDDAALAFVVGELQQRVERAAFLERGGELQVLELHPDIGLGDARQRLAAQARRMDDRAGNAGGSCADVGERDGKSLGHASSLAPAPVAPQADALGRHPAIEPVARAIPGADDRQEP